MVVVFFRRYARLDRDEGVSAVTQSGVCVTAYVLGDLCGDTEPASVATRREL